MTIIGKIKLLELIGMNNVGTLYSSVTIVQKKNLLLKPRKNFGVEKKIL